MLKEIIEPVDLTSLTDDEHFYKGQCFYDRLKELLDEFKPLYGGLYFYKILYDVLSFIKNQLAKEERLVE